MSYELFNVQVHHFRLGHHDEEEDCTEDGHDQAGHDEAETPGVLDERPGQQGANDVPNRGVRVPDPKDEALFALAEPVGHDGDDTGPAAALNQAAEDLNQCQQQILQMNSPAHDGIAFLERFNFASEVRINMLLMNNIFIFCIIPPD